MSRINGGEEAGSYKTYWRKHALMPKTSKFYELTGKDEGFYEVNYF